MMPKVRISDQGHSFRIRRTECDCITGYTGTIICIEIIRIVITGVGVRVIAETKPLLSPVLPPVTVGAAVPVPTLVLAPETMTAAAEAIEGSHEGPVLVRRAQEGMLMDDVATEEGIPVASNVDVVQFPAHCATWIDTSLTLLGGCMPPDYRCMHYFAACKVVK